MLGRASAKLIRGGKDAVVLSRSFGFEMFDVSESVAKTECGLPFRWCMRRPMVVEIVLLCGTPQQRGQTYEALPCSGAIYTATRVDRLVRRGSQGVRAVIPFDMRRS